MANAIIEKTIQNYLDAVEHKYGRDNRGKTVVKYLGSTTFFLKKHHVEQGRTIDMDDLQLMTRHLKSA